MTADDEGHRFWAETLAGADALIFGRITYEMMESAWRPIVEGAAKPDWVADWMLPFAEVIHNAKKFVVSKTLKRVDWNAELLPTDFVEAIRELKQQPGDELRVCGVTVPRALAELGLIDEYELVVHPRIVGHGPSLFAGLSGFVDLQLIGQKQFKSGAMAMRYAAKR